MTHLEEVVDLVRSQLAERADAEKAAGMSWYMQGAKWREMYPQKEPMPFYGVQKPGRVPILREIKRSHAPETHREYLALVEALWDLPHREEKYLAQAVATAFQEFMVPESLPLYTRFIVEGAWWDFVDETATHMVRELVLGFPERTWPVVDSWNQDDDMWLRRTSILCQIGAKERTDTGRLFTYCERRMDETEFFIRKAIGWALREHAKTDPRAVADFVTANRDRLSGLSYREATKHIGDLVGGR